MKILHVKGLKEQCHLELDRMRMLIINTIATPLLVSKEKSTPYNVVHACAYAIYGAYGGVLQQYPAASQTANMGC